MKKDGCPKGQVQMGKHCIPSWCKTHYIDHYGRGSTLVNRGYLLPDGSVMDFGKMGHTKIAKPHGKSLDMGIMSGFLKACKAVRYSISKFGKEKKRILVLESHSRPTDEQASQFVKLIAKADKLYGERSGSEIWPCSYEKSKPTPLDVQQFITRCW